MPRGEGAVPDRNLALDLVRTTEAAALASARWVGRGEKNPADGAAVDAMRLMFNTVPVDGIVVIGEGEKDEAPMLYNGEHVGAGGPAVDIAVDPIDGTTLLSRGQEGALAVVAAAERGTMFDPGPCVYMEKIAAGPEGGPALDITRSIEENVRAVAAAREMEVQDITVIILDRDRNKEAIDRVRKIGARVKLIEHGDIAAALTAAMPSTGVDILYGIGGTPEGVTAAAALRCLGGIMQGRLWPRNDEERKTAIDLGYDLDRVLTTEDLCGGDEVFFAATGVTDGVLLQGVRYTPTGATSESLVMRAKSGTTRRILSEHRFRKLQQIAGNRYA
ncbi:MAG: class II fructose-bisphosphatase [Actinomycetota bacterium]|nr:class II fructose-bisphosphatase [Actinomycetota bacterium]